MVAINAPMKPLPQRTFDIFALSLPRGLAFGTNVPVGAYISNDGLSFGALRFDGGDRRFGFLNMRRRADHVWTLIEEDGAFKDAEMAKRAMASAMRDGRPLEPLPRGARARPALHEIGPKGVSAVFDLLRQRGHHAAAWALNQVYLAMPSPDPQWARDCQTANFHTRLWEAYLLACFREQGRLVIQGNPSPDFHVSDRAGHEAWIEAVTANAAEPYNHVHAKPLAGPKDLIERQTGSAAERFAKTLHSKLQRGYDQLPYVAGKPFAIAIADFHAPGSMMWSREALPTYLYGQYALVEEKDGQRAAVGRSIQALIGEHSIPAGLFRNPVNSGLSAVIFSNAGTMAKFNRMGFLAGAGSKGVSMVRSGFLFDRTPGAVEAIPFRHDIASIQYDALWPDTGETWSLELEVCHNPLARHPMSMDLLPESTHWFEQDGEVVCRAFHKNTVLTSTTLVHCNGAVESA